MGSVPLITEQVKGIRERVRGGSGRLAPQVEPARHRRRDEDGGVLQELRDALAEPGDEGVDLRGLAVEAVSDGTLTGREAGTLPAALPWPLGWVAGRSPHPDAAGSSLSNAANFYPGAR